MLLTLGSIELGRGRRGPVVTVSSWLDDELECGET